MRLGPLLVLLAVTAAGCRSTEAPAADAAGAPAQKAVQLEIEGNQTFDDAELRAAIATEIRDVERRGSSKAVVDDAAFSLELYYREQGFPGCTVEYRIEDVSATDTRATLLVQEGPRVRITAARFAGNASIAAEELIPFVQPTSRTFAPDAPNWFHAGRVRDGLSAIQGYYRGKGFLDARVRLEAPKPDEEDWKPEIELVIRIEEGPRWILREITLEGGIDEVDRKLERAAFVGKPLTPGTASTLRGLLRELYGRAGYPEAGIEATNAEAERAGDARIRVRIVPGPLVHITGIDVVGNERTNQERLVNASELQPGERYDVEKERESLRNLYRLGVFSSVALTLVGEGEERRLRIQVDERESRELYVEPGYGSYEGLRLGVGWHELNLAGTARRLELEGTVSALALHGRIGLTDPRFLESQFAANVSLFGDNREEPSYTETKVGARLGITREIDQDLDLQATYEYSKSRLDSTDIEAPSVVSDEEAVDVSSIAFTPRWDSRDSTPLPTTGRLIRPTLEWADSVLGSELDFVRLRWNLGWYDPLSERAVIALSWRGGVIAPYGSTTEIPIQERFFNGGESTVRSFREDQLGPKDADGNPIGGESFNVLTAELRYGLIGHVEGALFVDAGNVIEDYTEFFQFDDFRFALGAGLRYLLPVGPLRFDAGLNPNPRAHEADYAAHFSVGFSF